jgi:hypothetical protein
MDEEDAVVESDESDIFLFLGAEAARFETADKEE